MDYRPLGRSGLRVGVIGLGAEHLENAPAETVVSVVHEALDHGVNYIDLFMGSPGVRDNFGLALRGRREEVLIAGHLGAIWEGQYAKSRDKKVCEDFIHDLLRRTGVDALGVLMLHFADEPADVDAVLAPDGLLELALRLKEQGKARCLGLSTHKVSAALRAVESGFIDAVMFPVNPLFDRLPGEVDLESLWKGDPYAAQGAAGAAAADREEFYHACARHGVSVVAMKPYAASWLFAPENAGGMALTPVQCLSYALAQPGVACVVPGCRTADEMRAAIAYLDASPEQRDYSAINAMPLWRQRGGCMYCNHCLPCPAGIDVAAVTRLVDSAARGVTEIIRSQYAALSAKASACLDCGECRARCPFGIDAPAAMRQAGELLG